MSFRAKVLLGSLAALLALAIPLLRPPAPPSSAAPAGSQPLLVFCAAGLKPPVEALAREYQARYGVTVELQYGGSGTLLSNLRISRRGDLFIAADSSYVELARTQQLVAEVLPLARQTPVLIVPRANPKGLRSLADLRRPGLALSLANPEAAAVGRATRDRLRQLGLWDAIAAQARVFKPTVGEVANDVKLGAADAGFVWDATARQYPDLLAVPLPEFADLPSEVAACVLHSAPNPRAALHLARYLAARDRGRPAFEKAGFAAVEADPWSEHPEITLFSGAVNRVAIEDTVRRFEEREGAQVNRVYNGCGILVGQMKAGRTPDAYFACDVSFLREVQPLFHDGDVVSETRVVLLTRPGNPLGLHDLPDLARPGLRLGVANPEQSALGALTRRLLDARQLTSRVSSNVVVQTPTADLLVNQLRAGALDVAVVYQANTSAVVNSLEVIPLPDTDAVARQPYAISRNTAQPQLVGRLHQALRADASRGAFEQAGFRWLAPPDVAAR